MIPQQIIDALKKVFAFVDDKLKVSDAQLDVALSTRASESTLSAIKTQTDKLQFDANNFLRAAIASDELGLASESTLSAIKSQTDKLTFADNDKLKTSQQDDILQRKDRTTTTDEFIASGMEFAFNNYTISAGNETRLDGKLILKSLTVEGSIIINGTLEFD